MAKPVTGVAGLEVPEKTSDFPKSAVHKIHKDGDDSGEMLPDPLK